jgi:hypothetical protein
MLVTAEAAPDAPGGGYNLVFRADDQHYLYRATSGIVQLVEADYEFSEAGVWHAAEFAHAAPPHQMPGDFNVDGRVDDQDHAVWRSGYGSWSLTEFLPADGNRNGIIDLADSVIWRKNLGAMAGDFDRSAAVDQADYDTWRSSYNSTSDLRADGNHDRVIDAADYVVWRKAQIGQPVGGAAVAEAAQASAMSIESFAAGVEHAGESRVVVVSALGPVASAGEFVAADSTRAKFTRDDAPRRLAFESVAAEVDDLNLLTSLEWNAGDYAANQPAADEILEPAHVAQAEAIDLALDLVFAPRPLRSLRAHW